MEPMHLKKDIFEYLRKQNQDVIYLQETHLREKKDVKYLIHKALGEEFISASSKRLLHYILDHN